MIRPVAFSRDFTNSRDEFVFHVDGRNYTVYQSWEVKGEPGLSIPPNINSRVAGQIRAALRSNFYNQTKDVTEYLFDDREQW